MWRIFGGRKREAELDDELQAHIEIEARRLEREGLAGSEASAAARRAFGASRGHAGGDAGVAANLSGRAMVDRLAAAREAAEAVPDPELPAVTIADLGILRDVVLRADGRAEFSAIVAFLGGRVPCLEQCAVP